MEKQNETLQDKIKAIDVNKIKQTGAVVVPSIFTLANMGFGFFSILAASEGNYIQASWLLVISYFMDMLDGRIARFLHGESSFGVEIDSLSDWMSFGIAPAYLIFKFALKDIGYIGYAIAFLYVLCGALRLARYNLKSHFGESDKNHFQGLPIPGAAGVVLAIVLNYSKIEMDGGGRSLSFLSTVMPSLYPLIPYIVVTLALLMISNAPYPAFKGSQTKLSSHRSIIFLTAILGMFLAYPRDTMLILFSLYALYGLIVGLGLAFKHLFKPKTA